MKLALAVFAADLLARRADRRRTNRARWWCPLLGLLAVSGLLVLKQPDMGTALVLAFITFALLYAGGVPLRPVLKALGVTAVIGLIVGLAEPYRRARLLSFLDPFAHAKGSGYQVVQSLVGLGSGHLYGLGLGGGREKWGLLPNAHTDFIFSVIGEEGGLVGDADRARPVRRAGVVRAAGRRPGPGPLRGAAGRGRHVLDHEPGGHQHRGRHRRAARHRHPAAVHLLRGLVAGHHAGGGRASWSTWPPHERPPGLCRPRGRGRPRRARGRVASPGSSTHCVAATAGEYPALRPGGGGRDRWAPRPGAGRGPGPGRGPSARSRRARRGAAVASTPSCWRARACP